MSSNLLKNFTACYLAKVVSPTHKDWVEDLNLVKGTLILVLCHFFDFVFQFLNVLLGGFHQKDMCFPLPFGWVLFEMESKEIKSSLNVGLVSFILV